MANPTTDAYYDEGKFGLRDLIEVSNDKTGQQFYCPVFVYVFL